MNYISNVSFIPSLVDIKLENKLKKSLSNEENTTSRNKTKSIGAKDDLQQQQQQQMQQQKQDDNETNDELKKKKNKFNLIISKPTTSSNTSKLILYNFRQYKNRKVFRTLLTVTCSLIIFWAPWITLWPVDAACQCVPRYIYIWIYSMEYMNSLANSIFIVAGNQHFRRKFLFYMKKLFHIF
jgi:hypothetical protein